MQKELLRVRFRGLSQVKIFGGRETFWKKVSLPPNPYPFKNFEKGQKDSFVLQNICCKSPFKKVFEE